MNNDKILRMTNIIFKFYPQARSFFRGFVSIRSLPISITQLVALQTVEGQDNITMSRLADSLEMSNQQLTKVVDALVSYELVNRTIDPANRRQILVSMSPKGTKMLSQLEYEITKKLSILFSKMPASELDRLYNSLLVIEEYFTKLQDVLAKK